MLSRHNFLKGSTKCLSKSSACFFTGLFAVGSAQPGVGFASEKIGNEKVNSIVKSEKDSVPDYEKKKDIALAKLKALKNECSSCIESSKKSDFSKLLSTKIKQVINSEDFRRKFIGQINSSKNYYNQHIGGRCTDEGKKIFFKSYFLEIRFSLEKKSKLICMKLLLKAKKIFLLLANIFTKV